MTPQISRNLKEESIGEETPEFFV